MKLYTEKYSEHVGSGSGYAGFRNRRRVALFTRLIPVTLSDHVLEIGPNNCLLLDALKQKAGSVTGIELNEEVVSRMNRPDLLCMDATELQFPDAIFSIIIGIEVFEHIPDIKQAFSEIARVLKPGGKIYLTVPFEIFRGQQALGDAWKAFRDLRKARELHVHKLNPARIRKFIAHTDLRMICSKLLWIPAPSYYMELLKK